jgi:hypothetical protein
MLLLEALAEVQVGVLAESKAERNEFIIVVINDTA